MSVCPVVTNLTNPDGVSHAPPHSSHHTAGQMRLALDTQQREPVQLPTLTYAPDGDGVRVDLDRLLETRLLLTANSGGGKSTAIRQLLESTHGRVMQLVIDPEGEFSTLRERFDYVLAAKSGGDVEATPRTARVLCRKLVTLGASTILDLYDLKLNERQEFVRLFLDELMSLPRALWRPILVVIDEAQTSVPERGHGESVSTDSVITLCTQGRKRGFCAALATLRISAVNKNAAAQLLNKLVGRTDLDVDVKRAGDDLGFGKDERLALKRLKPGEFFAYGPAISDEVRRVRTGAIVTSHPKLGKVAAPPAASASLRALLEGLADLPKQATEEARTLVDLQAENAKLRAELRRAGAGVDHAALASQVAAAVHAAREESARDREALVAKVQDAIGAAGDVAREIGASAATLSELARFLKMAVVDTPPLPARLPRSPQPVVDTIRRQVHGVARAIAEDVRESPDVDGERLSGPQARTLEVLAQFEQRGTPTVAETHVRAFSGQAGSPAGWTKNLGILTRRGLVERHADGTMELTPAGRRLAPNVTGPLTLADLHESWLGVVGAVQRRMLEALLEAHPSTVDRHTLAMLTDQAKTPHGFAKNVSTLSTLGLVERRGDEIACTSVLFPAGLR